jgi:pimeloyl-ACP methyl ester carboxylesterase
MIETIRISDLTLLRALPTQATRPPVLLLHGYFIDASVWRDWLEFLAKRGFPAYALNFRGRANSRPAPNLGGVSIDDFVRDALDAARALDRPIVVGHSMGGLVAQKLAEADAVRAAALLAPAPPRGISVLSPQVVIKQIKYLPAIFRSRTVIPSRADMRALVLNRVPPRQQDTLLASFIPDSGRAGRDMSVTGVKVDRKRARCPMLVVSAQDDLFIPPRIGRRVAARYRAPFQLVQGHGHMLVIEPGWEVVADMVARWAGELKTV